MVVGAKLCIKDDFLWFVCGLYVEILTSPLIMLNLIHIFSVSVYCGRFLCSSNCNKLG